MELQHQVRPDREGNRLFRFTVVVLFLSLFWPSAAYAIQGLHAPASGSTDYAEINRLLQMTAERYGIPPVLLKAIAFQESGWDHHWQPGDAARGAFSEQHHWRYWNTPADSAGYVKLRLEPPTPSFPQGAVGIGIMQITIPFDDTGQPRDKELFRRLANDLAFNIDQGARHLLRFYSAAEAAPQLIENWWYPTYRYNGFGEQAKGYSERIRDLVRQPPAKIAAFTTPMDWTLPWEVYPTFRVGSLRTGPADRFLAHPEGAFSFHAGAKQSTLPGAVHTWSSPNPADLRFVLFRGQSGGGTIQVAASNGPTDYQWEERVSLTAHPEHGWEFSHWLDSALSTSSSGEISAWGWPELTITMTGHRYIEAVFLPLEDYRSVHVSIAGTVERAAGSWPVGSEAILLVQRPGISYGTAFAPLDPTGAFSFRQVPLDPRWHYVVAVRPTATSSRLTSHSPLIYVQGDTRQSLQLPTWQWTE